MRLGDLDALLKLRFNMYMGFCGTVPVVAVEDIEKAKTIDAVEVVRCKDCKFYDIDEDGWYFCICFGGLCQPDADDFCSLGERKDGEG